MKTRVSLSNSASTEQAHLEKSLEAVPGVSSVEVHEHEIVIEHEGANEDELTNTLKRFGLACQGSGAER